MDADARIRELEPPTLTVGGQTYQGRFLSAQEWERLEPRILQLIQGELVGHTFRLFLVEVLGIVFPGRWWHRLVWWRSPAWLTLKLPLGVQFEVLQDFFSRQDRANTAGARVSPTRGSSSPRADSEPPAERPATAP